LLILPSFANFPNQESDTPEYSKASLRPYRSTDGRNCQYGGKCVINPPHIAFRNNRQLRQKLKGVMQAETDPSKGANDSARHPG